MHTSYALAVAATGRFFSNNPNLQNIPIRAEEGRRIRRAFVAEPGHVLLSADYSQIELRLAAHVADVPELKQAFRDGIDIHALTASQVFGVPLAQMDANTRRRAKAINFGIIYGISAFGLGQQIGVPQAEAGAYIRAYFERFPAIRAYMERIKADCRRTGYVETIFGRKCWIPGIRDVNPARRAGAERQAINAPLQGSAADIIKRAMARIPATLAREKLHARSCCRSMTNCCSRRRKPRSSTPPRSSAGSWKAPARHIANSRCRSLSKPAGTKRINRRWSAQGSRLVWHRLRRIRYPRGMTAPRSRR